MPQIEVIEKLKPLINALGDEDAYNEEHGLAIDDILPPDPIVDSELNELLDDQPVSSTGDDAPEDMDSLLASFQEELENEDEEPEEEQDESPVEDSAEPPLETEETESTAPVEDFNFDDINDLDNIDELDGLESVDDESPDSEPVEEKEQAPEADFPDEEFNLDSLGDLDAELPEEETGEESVTPAEDQEYSSEELLDAEDFDIPEEAGDIESLDEEELTPEADTGEMDSTPEDTSAIPDSEEFPSLESESFSDDEIAGLTDAFGDLEEESFDETDGTSDGEKFEEEVSAESDSAEEIEELPDLEDIPEMDDFGDLSMEGSMDSDEAEIPDINAKLDSLAAEADETSEDEMDLEAEINLSEELSDDFLDDISDEEEDGAQHFSLDDLGAGFNLDENDSGAMLGMDIDQIEQEIDDQEDEIYDENIEISPSDLQAIQRTLNTFPRNLKIEIETLLGDDEFEGPKLRNLLNLLISGNSPRQVSNQIFRMTGKKVVLPKGYEKKTATEFLEKKKGFVYIFTQEGWPLLRKILIGIAAAWVLFILSFTLLYRPLTAHSYYKRGYEQIQTDQYNAANENFGKGYFGWNLGPMEIKGWRIRKWFYRYAEAYRERHAYQQASQKYEQLLQVYPDDWKGRYDYADMLTYDMGSYERAERELLKLLEADISDYEAMLALGDNYFYWSDIDPSQLENARKTYAGIIDYYGNMDDVQFRMIRYFLKTNDHNNLQRLTNMYKEKSKISGDPKMKSEVFSELAGYHLDMGEQGDAVFFLEKANDADPLVPELHYQYARYYKQIYSPELEEIALNTTLFNLELNRPLSRRETEIEIDTYKRLGDLYSSRSDYDRAEQEYLNAITLYQKAEMRNQIQGDEKIGELYATTGNIYYFVRSKRDLNNALDFFLKAEDLGYDTPELQYRKGYIYYTEKEDLETALLYFYQTTRAYPHQVNARYALANTLMKKRDYYSAQGTYEEILKLIQDKEEAITFLVPNEKPEHREIIEMYKRIHNNLGVALYQISRKSPGNDWYSGALYQFTKSSEYSDILTRDPETLSRPREMSETGLPGSQPIYTSFDLAYDNRMLLLYPIPGQTPAIYENLQMDLDTFHDLDDTNN